MERLAPVELAFSFCYNLKETSLAVCMYGILFSLIPFTFQNVTYVSIKLA